MRQENWHRTLAEHAARGAAEQGLGRAQMAVGTHHDIICLLYLHTGKQDRRNRIAEREVADDAWMDVVMR